MISRRSLFGLALLPLAPAEDVAAEIGGAFMPALDMKECYHFKSMLAQPFPEEFATYTNIHGTMRRIKLNMIEHMSKVPPIEWPHQSG